MALAPIKMTHEQRLAWLLIEGWEPVYTGTVYGMAHHDKPGKMLVITETTRPGSRPFKLALLCSVKSAQRVRHDFSKQDTEVFMRKVRWMNGEGR